ncbi:hypothetical protein C7974DRAFT_139048 [Boeremia exigua]|uniref:uncharacterized protein n=1 Tax=Boeremia exigua TaxID=749465 RepID=UPI001E8D85B8|nr:uncharacterized protein C7974DRAFT_139048 [Boeremia exigua]KAH6639800.1 hypothetical protein C7974DRAFT_139048 [Boeremia exigua]
MPESQDRVKRDPPPPIGHASADGMVLVQVGPDKITHHVHKTLLVYHSEYFAKALNGPWAEAVHRVVTIEDVETDAFNIFVHWLYTRQVPQSYEALRHLVNGSTSSDPIDRILVLLKAHHLGDRIIATAFRCEIKDRLVQSLLQALLSPATILPAVAFAFANIYDSNIHDILVARFCDDFNAMKSQFEDDVALVQFPPTFTALVIKQYSERMPNDLV